jgi:hypothetical protein
MKIGSGILDYRNPVPQKGNLVNLPIHFEDTTSNINFYSI